MKKLFCYLLIPSMTLGARAQGPRVTTHSQPPDAIALKAARGLPFISIRESRSYQSAELTLENSGDSTTVTVKVKGAPDLALGTPILAYRVRASLVLWRHQTGIDPRGLRV